MTAGLFAVLVLALAVVAAKARRRPVRVVATVTAGTAAVAVVLSVAGLGLVALALGLLAAAVAAVAAALLVVRRSLAAGRQRALCGPEALVGEVGVVRRPLDPVGQILVKGELWRARRSWAEEDEPPPLAGEPVVVENVQSLTLSVRRAESWEVEG